MVCVNNMEDISRDGIKMRPLQPQGPQLMNMGKKLNGGLKNCSRRRESLISKLLPVCLGFYVHSSPICTKQHTTLTLDSCNRTQAFCFVLFLVISVSFKTADWAIFFFLHYFIIYFKHSSVNICHHYSQQEDTQVIQGAYNQVGERACER